MMWDGLRDQVSGARIRVAGFGLRVAGGGSTSFRIGAWDELRRVDLVRPRPRCRCTSFEDEDEYDLKKPKY
jgi:hypothetical protein